MMTTSLILPFAQQLSRIEEISKFAFWKFEKRHASFENAYVHRHRVGVHEIKRERECRRSISAKIMAS